MLKKMSKRWFRFINSGYDEQVYDTCKKEILSQNSTMVTTSSFIGGIVMALLTLVTFFLDSVSRVRPLYFVTAILFIAIYVISVASKRRSRVVTLLCNYAFLAAAFFFAIGLDVIQRNDTATTICVLLVSLPLLIVDKPLRENFFFLVMSICFMLESVYIKQSPKASIDVLNAVVFFVVGSFLGYKHNQMILKNITGSKLLERQRDIDPLTELYNKGALESKAMQFLITEKAEASLIVIDMDNFKFVNDTYGHHAGDEILAKIGQVLTSLFRSIDLICRFGGDEFVVFMPGTSDKETLKTRAKQILKGVEQIRIHADASYRAHICMGIATYPQDGCTYEELFKNADSAMYLVKKNGKNGYEFYNANRRKKILVVDDIEVNRAVIVVNLEAEYDVLEAEDGEQALAVLRQNKDTSLVITDLQMPNMDGVELIKKIRANREFGKIAIIANTQYGDVKQEEQMIKLGVNDFVYKAACGKVIQMRVKNVLKQ